MKLVLAIAAGGALGAVARHLFAAHIMRWTGGGFPWGILAVNVLGSFLMGILVHALMHLPEPMPNLRAFLVVGVLGAFTTFSTYALDVVLLIERGELGAAAGYALASVVLSVGGLFAGMALARAAIG
jgi:CrcB protein